MRLQYQMDRINNEPYIKTFCPYRFVKGRYGNVKIGSLACQECKYFDGMNGREHYVSCDYRKPTEDVSSREFK